MRPPESGLGVVGTSVGIVAAASALGAVGGYYVARARNPANPLANAVTAVEMGVLGAIAAGFAGVIVAAASPKWREVGEGTAVVGVGGPLVLATIGVVKQSAALGSTGPARTYNVTSADSGTTVNMNVGDTLNVLLPSATAAPTVTSTGVLATSSSQVSGTYTFIAAKAGTVSLVSGTDFTLTITVT